MEAGDSFFMEQLASQLRPYVLVLIVDPLPPPSSNGTDIFFFCIWSVPGSSTFYLSKAYKYVDRWYLQCHRLNSTSCNPDGSSFSSPRMGYNHQKHGHSIRGLSKKKRCADHLWKKTQKGSRHLIDWLNDWYCQKLRNIALFVVFHSFFWPRTPPIFTTQNWCRRCETLCRAMMVHCQFF